MAHPEIPREILSERLALRLYQPGDAAGMLEGIDESRAELTEWMAWAPFMRTLVDVERFIERAAAVEPGDTDVILGIFRRSDGRFLGGTGYHDIDWRVPKMSIGYWMRTSETGKGYVRETVTALTRVGFGQLGLRRLVITCAGTNDRSRRVAEACGYHLDGCLRNDERRLAARHARLLADRYRRYRPTIDRAFGVGMTRPPIPDRIETERLVLRLYQPSDAASVFEAIDESRAELEPWFEWTSSLRTLEDEERFIWSGASVRQCDTAVILGIFRRSDGHFLGGTGYQNIDWQVPKMSTGYWLRTSETRKGYARETVKALTQAGFLQLGLRRLVITCAGTNDRSRRVAEACGYHLDGCLRNDDRLPDGSLRDTLVYSLIDTDEAVLRLLAEHSP